MFHDISRLSDRQWLLFLAAVVATAWILAVQWRKARLSEMEVPLKRELLALGWSIQDIDRLLQAGRMPKQVIVAPVAEALSWRNPLATFGGMAAVLAVIFAGVALIVRVSGCGSSGQAQQRGGTLTPERYVVSVNTGGSASCRVSIGRGNLYQYSVQLTAAVIAQDNLQSKLGVEITPTTMNLGSRGEDFCDVQLKALSGTGEFTVRVTASDYQHNHAETTIVVLVRRPPPVDETGSQALSPAVLAGQQFLLVSGGVSQPQGFPGVALTLATATDRPRGQ